MKCVDWKVVFHPECCKIQYSFSPMICHAQFLLVKFSIKKSNYCQNYICAACNGICFQFDLFFVYFSRLPIWPRFVSSFHEGKIWQVINGTADINGDKFIRSSEIATKRFTYTKNADWFMIHQNQFCLTKMKVANEVIINVIDLGACIPYTSHGRTNETKQIHQRLCTASQALLSNSWDMVKCEKWLHTM